MDGESASDVANEQSSSSATPRWWPVIVLLEIALVCRNLYWVLVRPEYAPNSDAAQYHELASNVAAGRGYSLVYPARVLHPTAFRPPLFPLLLASVYKVVGAHVWVGQILNLLLGLVVVGLVYWLARRLGGPVAGLVAGGVAAVYPPLIANDVSLLTEPLSLALMLGMLLAFTYRHWWLGGALCGLLVLTRPSAQYLALVIAVWVLWQFGWKRALGVLVIAALVVSPWVVRNWVQLGTPVTVTSNGFNWAALYSPQAQAAGGFVDPSQDPSFEDYRLVQQDEVQWQRALQDLAFSNLRRDPGQVLGVMGNNALAYFELDPSRNANAEVLDGRNLDFRSATLPLFYVVTTVGLVGLVVNWRKPVVVLILAVIAYFALSSLVFVSAPRLRAPVDVLCCVGVGLLGARVRSVVPRGAGVRGRDSTRGGWLARHR